MNVNDLRNVPQPRVFPDDGPISPTRLFTAMGPDKQALTCIHHRLYYTSHHLVTGHYRTGSANTMRAEPLRLLLSRVQAVGCTKGELLLSSSPA